MSPLMSNLMLYTSKYSDSYHSFVVGNVNSRLKGQRSTFQASAVVCALLVSLSGLVAGEPFGNSSIPASAVGDGSDFVINAPWIVPAGYEQMVMSGESDFDIYTEPTATGGRSNDWYDMNTVNETRKHAGRYLYRTHEVRGNAERGGVVSVVDLVAGGAKILVEDPSYDALDGIIWTPWGTLLFAEEKTGGRFFEVILDPKDPSTALDVIDRPAVGRLAHEGIQIGADGAIYVVDEFSGEVRGYGGGVYKFVPVRRGDLSAGNLYALSVTGGPFGTGQGSWVGPIDPLDARNDGTLHGGTSYNRPEDLERIGNTLYVALTRGPRGGLVRNCLEDEFWQST